MPEDNEDGPTDRMSVWPDGNRVPGSGSENATSASGSSSHGSTEGHIPQAPAWPDAAGERSGVPEESGVERTEKLTPVPATAGWVHETGNASSNSGPSTATWSFDGQTSPSAAGSGSGSADGSAKKRRGLLGAGIAVALLVLLYLGDILFTGGQVPRGTSVAGVDIGSMDKASAQQKLRKAAFRWLARQPWHEQLRFDVAVVVRGQVRIIENAF